MSEHPWEAQEDQRQARGEYDEDLAPILERSIALAAARQREKLAYELLKKAEAHLQAVTDLWEKRCSEMYEIEGLN